MHWTYETLVTILLQFLVIHSILAHIQYLLSRGIFILIKVPTRSALRMLTKAMSVIWIFNNRMAKSAHWHFAEYRFLEMKGNDDTDEVLFFARTRGTQSRVRTFRSHSSQHLRLLYLEKFEIKVWALKLRSNIVCQQCLCVVVGEVATGQILQTGLSRYKTTTKGHRLLGRCHPPDNFLPSVVNMADNLI